MMSSADLLDVNHSSQKVKCVFKAKNISTWQSGRWHALLILQPYKTSTDNLYSALNVVVIYCIRKVKIPTFCILPLHHSLFRS